MATAAQNIVTVRNPIKSALSLVQSVPQARVEQAAKQLVTVVSSIAAMNDVVENLIGCEKAELPEIRRKLTELKTREKQLKSMTDPTLVGMPIFSLVPLTWRRKDGMPYLAVFSIDSEKFEIAAVGKRTLYGSSRVYWKRTFEPKLSKDVLACYADVVETVAKKARSSRKSIRLRAEFRGMMPAAVKQRIKEVKPLFQEIFIVTEVSDWKMETSPIPAPPKDPDPLVVGFDGTSYRLIAKFDTTSIEEAAADYLNLQ